jgi:hypothetical protein
MSDSNDGCLNILLFVMVLMMGALIGALFVILLSDPSNFQLQRGENFYCSDRSYLDIAEDEPLEIRFTCEGENGFETTFGGPNDQKLIEEIRDHAEKSWGMGVIVKDGQIVQLFELDVLFIQTHWSTETSE